MQPFALYANALKISPYGNRGAFLRLSPLPISFVKLPGISHSAGRSFIIPLPLSYNNLACLWVVSVLLYFLKNKLQRTFSVLQRWLWPEPVLALELH